MANGEEIVPPKSTPPQKSVTSFSNLNDLTNPYRLESSNNPGTVLVTELLSTKNYTTWSRAMQRAFRAKNKLGFITGTITRPTDPTDSLLASWERCNDMVVSWIQNSINLQLRSSVAFVNDAAEIWTELKDRFT